MAITAPVTVLVGPADAEPTMADHSETHPLLERRPTACRRSSHADALKLFRGSRDAPKLAAPLAPRLADRRVEVANKTAAAVEAVRPYRTVPLAFRVSGAQVREAGANATHTVEPVNAAASSPPPTVPTSSAATRGDDSPPPHVAVEKGSSGPWRTAGLAGAGVGLAVGVTGWLMLKSASSRANDARAHQDAPAYKDAKSSFSTGTFVLIGGAVVLVGGVALAIVDPGGTRPAPSGWRVAPAIAPGTAGLVFGGAY